MMSLQSLRNRLLALARVFDSKRWIEAMKRHAEYLITANHWTLENRSSGKLLDVSLGYIVAMCAFACVCLLSVRVCVHACVHTLIKWGVLKQLAAGHEKFHSFTRFCRSVLLTSHKKISVSRVANSLIEAEELTSNDEFVSYPVLATLLHDATYTVMQCLQESLPHHIEQGDFYTICMSLI